MSGSTAEVRCPPPPPGGGFENKQHTWEVKEGARMWDAEGKAATPGCGGPAPSLGSCCFAPPGNPGSCCMGHVFESQVPGQRIPAAVTPIPKPLRKAAPRGFPFRLYLDGVEGGAAGHEQVES